MKIRHATLVNQPLHTAYGVAQLDEQGIITNLDALEGTPEQLLAHVPGLLDADEFPPVVAAAPKTTDGPENVTEGGNMHSDDSRLPDGQDPTASTQTQENPGSTDEGGTQKSEPTDEEYWAVIEALEKEGAKMTAEGYVDTATLDAKLKELNMPRITGTRRKEITDQFRQKDAS